MFPRKFQHQNIWKKLFFKAKGFEIKTEKTYVSILFSLPTYLWFQKKKKEGQKNELMEDTVLVCIVVSRQPSPPTFSF